MNGNFYQNPTFPGNNNPKGNYDLNENVEGSVILDMEQSYIENIIRLNKGKKVKAYVSFPDSNTWKDKIFEGVIEESGRDHLIISNTKNGEWYLILMVYLNYIEFDERINYISSYNNTYNKM